MLNERFKPIHLDASSMTCRVRCSALILALALTVPAASKLAVKEISLGRRSETMVKYSRIVSADGRHIAFVEKVKDGKRVVFDGVAGKSYPDIPEVTLTEAGRRPELVLSP